jgi:hypothetical protein
MCAADGCPVAVEVFEGNTADPVTLAAQIDKLKQRFKLQRVVMVGDRGVTTPRRRKQGSQLTRRWSKPDSNCRSHLNEKPFRGRSIGFAGLRLTRR